MVESIDDPEQGQEVEDGAENAVQVDIHDVLEKLPFPDVVPVLKKHRRQQYQNYNLPHYALIALGGKYVSEGNYYSPQYHTENDRHRSLMNIVALKITSDILSGAGSRQKL